MRWVLALAACAACYAPKVEPGSPCSDTQPCPDGLVCSAVSRTCEVTATGTDGGPQDSTIDAPPVLIDGCTPAREICGNGVDEDCDGIDPPCPPNDVASGAIDVTAGGTFTANLKYAGDDAQKPSSGAFCGSTGGRDVFYTVHLTSAEVYYFDTFGSDFDTVIRVFNGTCANGAAPNGTACRNDSCTTTQSQYAASLGVGDHCIVIDQNSSAETAGSLHLRVERGHRNGSRLTTGPGVVTMGNTTSSLDSSNGTCAQPGHDDDYYFTACPGDNLAVTASTCNATTLWDTSLYAIGPAGELVCNGDAAACAANPAASTIMTQAAGAHLFWIIVDAGATGALGAYELDTTIQ